MEDVCLHEPRLFTMIHVEGVTHHYHAGMPDEICALRDVTLQICQGEFVTLLGHNGSGKSTLAKLFNALIVPGTGKVTVDGIDTGNEQELWSIRSRVGMVFQNPDNQLVAPTIEEELAFGPENLGVPREEIIRRIDSALKSVDLEKYRSSAPHLLSGGQKQRVAIASVLTMMPKYLVLDEPTAMLDPRGQREIMHTLRELNEEQGITIVLVTQNMGEAHYSKRSIVMSRGEIVMDDEPRKVFKDMGRIQALRLDVPPISLLAHRLSAAGYGVSDELVTVEEMARALACLSGRRGEGNHEHH
ncbi:MAG: energy-coupling factor transporter ATPase [Candidatus Eremiobacteraeota bacterium]|nr:energy-coupling factor transporter ATPase [Candidatus Eremiobacteraeota bacterium]